MGKRKLKYRPKKRAKRYFGESAAATADGDDHSESESSREEASVSAAKRKLDFGIPKWIIGDSSSSGGSDSSVSSSTDSDAGSEYPSDDTDDSSSPGDSDFDSGGKSQEELTGYRLVDLGCLQTIVSDACICNVRKVGNLIVKETARAGLATSISLTCDNVDCASFKKYPLVPKANQYFYDCNRRSVLAARAVGKGHRGLRRFCGIMNLPQPVSKSAFQRHQKSSCAASKSVAESSMQQASQEVRALNSSKDREEHITAVTFDGTWMKRGFTSLHGVFTCIGWEVGRVLDLHISTKHCHGCKHWKEKREHNIVSVAEYEAWEESHAASCPVNTTKSAPGMESEAAVLLWQRSQEKNKLEYHVFIGDGDSKSFSAVAEAQPYGPNAPVSKEECAGHVQKRIGSSLRTLKKNRKGEKLEDGKAIGGQGRLTDQMIDTLQTYYGNAVRTHQIDLQGMAKAIWASLCHRASTDDNPQHRFCPIGPESWCGWQLMKAGKQASYNHHVLPAAVMKAVKPTYVRLTERSLLERCLRGATQN